MCANKTKGSFGEACKLCGEKRGRESKHSEFQAEQAGTGGCRSGLGLGLGSLSGEQMPTGVPFGLPWGAQLEYL